MRSSRGFTLLEVIVALSILVGGAVLLGNAWSSNFLRVRKAKLYNNVAHLLERKMTEMEVKYRDKPLEEIRDEESGDFGKEFPQYRWTFKSQEFSMPDLAPVLIGREGGADDMLVSMIRQTTEFLSQSIKEATVSVFVKTKKREVEYSVTTYFVDFNRELSLPGAGGESGNEESTESEASGSDQPSGDQTGTGEGGEGQ